VRKGLVVTLRFTRTWDSFSYCGTGVPFLSCVRRDRAGVHHTESFVASSPADQRSWWGRGMHVVRSLWRAQLFASLRASKQLGFPLRTRAASTKTTKPYASLPSKRRLPQVKAKPTASATPEESRSPPPFPSKPSEVPHDLAPLDVNGRPSRSNLLSAVLAISLTYFNCGRGKAQIKRPGSGSTVAGRGPYVATARRNPSTARKGRGAQPSPFPACASVDARWRFLGGTSLSARFFSV
jgi:hypothetical protein